MRIFLIVLAFFLTTGVAQANIFGSTLVGWWTLDNSRISGTTVTDSSGQGNNGTTSGSPAGALGRLAQALNFVSASSQYVTVVNGVAPASTPTAFKTMANANSYSFSAWIKTSTSVAAPFNWTCGQVIIEARNANSSATHGWAFGINSTKLCTARTSNYTTTAELKNSSAAVNDGKWHFVVATVSTNAVTFYIDGKQDSTATFATATGDCSVGTGTGNVYVRIGARTTDGAGVATFATSIFDDVRVYNVALSAGDQASLYNLGIGHHHGAF